MVRIKCRVCGRPMKKVRLLNAYHCRCGTEHTKILYDPVGGVWKSEEWKEVGGGSE